MPKSFLRWRSRPRPRLQRRRSEWRMRIAQEHKNDYGKITFLIGLANLSTSRMMTRDTAASTAVAVVQVE